MARAERKAEVSWPSQDGGRVRRAVAGWAPPPAPAEKRPAKTAPPARWERDRVRAHLVEAFHTLRRLPLPANGRPAGLSSAWPEVVRQIGAYGGAVTKARNRPGDSRPGHSRSAPPPAAIDRMDLVLGWLLHVTRDRDRLALSGLVMGLHLRAIGRAAGCSHETARVWSRRALDEIATELNRRQVDLF